MVGRKSMKSVLLKISGELFKKPDPSGGDTCIDSNHISSIITQIKELLKDHRLSIVVGGGNFFRGSKEGRALNLRSTTADTVGMLATIMNGLILQELLTQHGVQSVVLSAYDIAGIARPIDQDSLDHARTHSQVIIFTGGTGNPFFTTDTNAVLRALQIEATEVWKATTVDGVYDKDPRKNADAKLIKIASYQEVLENKIGVMDATAIALAQEHTICIRIFSLYTPGSLLHVGRDKNFGSTIK